MFTAIAKYLVIGLAICLVGAIGYGLWQRSEATGALAQAKASADALTQAQSDLLIARSAAKADSTITIEVNIKLDVINTVYLHYVEDRDAIERTDPDVATYLNAPIPDAYRRLLNAPDRVSGPPGAASGEPAGAASNPAKPSL